MIDFEGSRSEFLNLLAEFGEQPAFLRRATALEEATTRLDQRCRLTYEPLLKWPRSRLASLTHRVAGDWTRCERWLVDPGDTALLRDLAENWHSRNTPVIEHHWSLRRALKAFTESAERCNQSWLFSLEDLDIDQTNQARRNYNRYYPVEMDCAFGGEIGGWQFEPVPMLTNDEILQRYPLLPTPRVR